MNYFGGLDSQRRHFGKKMFSKFSDILLTKQLVDNKNNYWFQ